MIQLSSLPDKEERMFNSANGSRAHEARMPPQDREMWVLDIENRLGFQFQNLTDQSSTTGEDGPSIYPSDCLPKKFDIGVHVYDDSRNNPLWKYAAFMSQWLRFNAKLYLKFMEGKELLARQYYIETDERALVSDSNCFLESLMVGSCFLVFAIVLFQKTLQQNAIELLKGSGYTDDRDQRSKQFRILYREIMNPQTQTKLDMLNIGNQIPWFAVEAMFKNSDLGQLCGTDNPVEKLAMSCFDDIYPRANKSKVQIGTVYSFKHLLHIFHWTRTPKEWSEARMRSHERLPSERFGMFYIPSATELPGSATALKKFSDGFCDVQYRNKRISAQIQIAPLHVVPYSNEVFSYLLEFEQKYFKCGLQFTAYIACMKSLLQTKEDVKLLQKKGIVQNTLKDQKDVLDFVHHFSKKLSDRNAFLPSDLICMMEEVNYHHRSRLGRGYAEFKSHFCPNRWVIISVIGALALFVLTLIQTIYTTLGYYKN